MSANAAGRAAVKFTGAVQRQITRDWSSAFPSFGVFEPRWLLKRAGSLLVGVLLERDSTNASYLPTAHLHSLTQPRPSICLVPSFCLRTVRTDAPDRIPVSGHTQRWEEAASRLVAQSPFPLLSQLTLSSVLSSFDRWFRSQHLGAFAVSAEDPILVAASVGATSSALRLLADAASRLSACPDQWFRRDGSFRRWLERVRNQIAERDHLQADIEEHARALGVAHFSRDALAVDLR